MTVGFWDCGENEVNNWTPFVIFLTPGLPFFFVPERLAPSVDGQRLVDWRDGCPSFPRYFYTTKKTLSFSSHKTKILFIKFRIFFFTKKINFFLYFELARRQQKKTSKMRILKILDFACLLGSAWVCRTVGIRGLGRGGRNVLHSRGCGVVNDLTYQRDQLANGKSEKWSLWQARAEIMKLFIWG